MLLPSFLSLMLMSVVYASGPCAPKEDLLKMLQSLHAAPSYSTMLPEYKAMVPELIAEAQSCQLTAYIYTVGFHKVLGFLDSLTPAEAHFFYNYFSQHMKYEQTLAAIYATTTTKGFNLG